MKKSYLDRSIQLKYYNTEANLYRGHWVKRRDEIETRDSLAEEQT